MLILECSIFTFMYSLTCDVHVINIFGAATNVAIQAIPEKKQVAHIEGIILLYTIIIMLFMPELLDLN